LVAAREHHRLLIICAAAFVLSLGIGLTSPVVSLYAQSLGVSTSLVGLYITIFALGRILVTIPAGRAADRWGRRGLLGIGPVIIAAAALGQAMVQSYLPLLAFRLVHGIGSALAMSAIYLSVADLTTPAERGRITGLFHTAILGGLTIGPAIGGVVADAFGLTGPFYGTVLVSLITGPVLWLSLPEHPSLAALAETGDAEAGPGPASASQTAKPARVADRLWADPNFVLVALAGFIIFVARAGARDTILPLLGHDELGLGAPQLGVVFTAMAAMNLVAVPIAGQVADRAGRKPAIFIGLLVIAGSNLLLGVTQNYVGFVLGSLLMGFGKGFSEPASMVYMTDISPAGKYGTSYGLFLTLRDVGLLAGPVILGRIADLSNLHLPLLVNAGVTLAVSLLFVGLARETLRRRQPTEHRA
jgi:MFS family permease